MGAYCTAYDLAIALGAALSGPVYAASGFAALNAAAPLGIVAAVPVTLLYRPRLSEIAKVATKIRDRLE